MAWYNNVASVAGVINAAGIGAADFAAQLALNTWLATTETMAPLHIATGLATQVVSQVAAPLVSTGEVFKVGNGQSVGEWMSKYMSSNPRVAEVMNSIFRATLFPNIEGIVIFAEKEQCTRKADVSEHIMVVQKANTSADYATDNAVPHPREWSLSGYITTILPTDHYFVLKPSISIQRAYLDMCMKARRPVWYKSFDNIFVKVLITDFDYSYDPKSTNTLQVTLRLKEYAPFEVSRAAVAQSVLNKIATTVIQ